MERDQASKFINDLLKLMLSRSGSDLFITADFPPAIKVDGKVVKVSPQPLNAVHTLSLARAIMNDKQAAEFERTKECNFAIAPPAIGRFRVSAFIQQGKVGMVLRTIPAVLPTIDKLGLPQVLKGYGDTQARGRLNYARLWANHVVPALTGAVDADTAANRLSAALKATLADPEGKLNLASQAALVKMRELLAAAKPLRPATSAPIMSSRSKVEPSGKIRCDQRTTARR